MFRKHLLQKNALCFKRKPKHNRNFGSDIKESRRFDKIRKLKNENRKVKMKTRSTDVEGQGRLGRRSRKIGKETKASEEPPT